MPLDELPHSRRVQLTARVFNPETNETHIVTLSLEITLPEESPEEREALIREWTGAWSRALV